MHNDGAPRCEVETFASRKGHVTDWHFDFMENFTLQLRGKKRWRLARSAVSHPLRGCTPQWGAADARVADAAETQAKCHAQHASGPFEPAPPDSDFDGADVVELDAGAMLYTPAGAARLEMVHETATARLRRVTVHRYVASRRGDGRLALDQHLAHGIVVGRPRRRCDTPATPRSRGGEVCARR